MSLELHADCSRCEGLCCILLAFDASEAFAFSKMANQRCPHLNSDNRCRIHSSLAEHGFTGCAGYDCYGAGLRATELAASVAWRDRDEEVAARFNLFTRLYELHELLVLLREAHRLELAHEYEAERLLWIREVERRAAGDASALGRGDVESLRGAVHAFLRQLCNAARRLLPIYRPLG